MISVILRYKSYFEFEASANRNQCIIISVLGNTKWISTLKIKCITCIIWMAFRIVSNYCNDDNNGWIRNLLPLNIASSINFVCILKSMQNENQEPFAITFQQQTIGYIVSNHIYFDCTLVTEFIVFFSCYERSNESSNLKWTLFIEKHFIGNWCKYKENILKCDGYLWFPFYEKWKESEWVGLCDQRTIRSIGNATYKNGNHFIDIVLRKSQYLASIVMWMNIIRFARIHKVSYIKFILHTEHTPTSYSHTMTCKQ